MTAAVGVEMGEVRVARLPGERLTAIGLGACIGLCLYDPVARLGAMAHIVLPQTPSVPSQFRGQPLASMPGKCADTAIPFLIAQILEQGACLRRLRAAMAGGAQIFSHMSASKSSGTPGLSRLEIGPRNTEAVRMALTEAGIVLLGEDVGGSCGRTLTFCIGTGDVRVRRIGAEEQTLAGLGQAAVGIRPERALVYGA